MKSFRPALFLALVATLSACSGPRLTAKPSPHFDRVSKQLDLGGVIYLYLDMDGDIEALAKGIQGYIEAIPDLKIDLPKITGALGLHALTAIGISSVKDGPVFHNKAFLYHQGRREGLLRISGDQPHPFEIPRMAPADADWVFEHDLHAKSVFEALEPLITEMAGPQALQDLDRQLPGLGLTLRQIIGMLDTRVIGILRLLPDQSTPVPGSEFTVPRIDALLAVDSLGELFDALQKMLQGMPMVRASDDDRLALLEFALPVPAGFDWLAPVLAKDKTTGRVYLATQVSLVHDCLKAANALGASGDFQKAVSGLPPTGNGLTYTSAGLTGKIQKIVEHLPATGAEERKIIQAVSDMLLPTAGIPTASVTTQLADGFYTVSNATSSHKESMILAQYLNPMVLGILSAVAIPAFVRYNDRATATVSQNPN